jgi:hypothetical protein
MKCIWKHLIRIFINDHYFLDDHFKIFVGCLNNTIHLGFVGRIIEILNLSFSVKLNNQLLIEILSIVSYKSYWYAVVINHIFFNEPLNYFVSHMRKSWLLPI